MIRPVVTAIALASTLFLTSCGEDTPLITG